MNLLTGKVTKPSAKVVPGSKKELEQIIDEHIKEIKPRSGQEVDLNWIDISEVDDLSYLFANVDYIPVVNKWDVSNVKDMSGMFACSNFNGNISGWYVSNVEDMSGMFERCPFDGKNGDISNWKVSKGTNMRWMFDGCPLENNPPKWYKDKK